MYLLFTALVATSFLVSECVSQNTPAVDFSQPVSPQVYQGVIKQGFATNYFKTQIPLAFKYRTQNIQDIYDKGFRNLRLRVRTDSEWFTAPYNNDNFSIFLTNITDVVDECIRAGVAPIISWENHQAEAYATEEEGQKLLPSLLGKSGYHIEGQKLPSILQSLYTIGSGSLSDRL